MRRIVQKMQDFQILLVLIAAEDGKVEILIWIGCKDIIL